ncbi:MAG TPA: energy transducer TonB [Terriglobales bacterium]|nr:energy transducer TonB [Terriglobales bacterium]
MNPCLRFGPLSSCSRFVLPFLLIGCGLVPQPAQAQQSPSKRKILTHTAPTYPSLARHMALSGVVRIDALVSPDGTVKMVDIKGGHPVLAQAASNTVRQWKWEPAPHESHEEIEIHFSPPE